MPDEIPETNSDSPKGKLWRKWFGRVGEHATLDVVHATTELVLSEREIDAGSLPETDLVRISQAEVLERAKKWAKHIDEEPQFVSKEDCDLLEAVTLLESREQDQKRLERQKKEIERVK